MLLRLTDQGSQSFTGKEQKTIPCQLGEKEALNRFFRTI